MDLYNTSTNQITNSDRIIPTNIFQTWKTHSFTDCRPTKIIKMNPTYKYWLFNDSEVYHFMNHIMVDDFEGNLTRGFNRIDDINGAAKSDLFRYAILWKFGGVYLDFDAVCFVSFDDIIHKNQTGFILSAAWPDELYRLLYYLQQDGTKDGLYKWLTQAKMNTIRPIQWMFMSAPKHKILTQTIEIAINNILDTQKQKEFHLNDVAVDMTQITRKVTGPGLLKQGVNEAIINHDLVKDLDFKIFGTLWNGKCKHYHTVKQFYRTDHVTRYNAIQDRTFLKQGMVD